MFLFLSLVFHIKLTNLKKNPTACPGPLRIHCNKHHDTEFSLQLLMLTKFCNNSDRYFGYPKHSPISMTLIITTISITDCRKAGKCCICRRAGNCCIYAIWRTWKNINALEYIPFHSKNNCKNFQLRPQPLRKPQRLWILLAGCDCDLPCANPCRRGY